ncbi:hypothetical protein PLICRDRAFT_38196 [Plicaturopsis crispa FD-325 SS-3]|nr:hypothetical protein PLICRDRAFT_38196 [Plicaturopsis crispa FD-325 SS-3]
MGGARAPEKLLPRGEPRAEPLMGLGPFWAFPPRSAGYLGGDASVLTRGSPARSPGRAGTRTYALCSLKDEAMEWSRALSVGRN